jgi:hypothetical protein
MTSQFIGNVKDDLKSIQLLRDVRNPNGFFDYQYVYTNNIVYNPKELSDRLIDESISLIKKNKKLFSSDVISDRYIIHNNNKHLAFTDEWKSFDDEVKLLLSIYNTVKNSGYIDEVKKSNNTICFSEYMKNIVESYYAEWYFKTHNLDKFERYMCYADKRRNNFVDGSYGDYFIIGFRYEIDLDRYNKLKNGNIKARFNSIEEWLSSPCATDSNKPKKNYNPSLINWKLERFKSLSLDNLGVIYRPFYLNDYEDISTTINIINNDVKGFIHSYHTYIASFSQKRNYEANEKYGSSYKEYIRSLYKNYSDIIIRKLNKNVLDYSDLVKLYKINEIGGYEYNSYFFGVDDSFDCKYYEFISFNDINWRLYYRVLEYGDNSYIWDAIIWDNFKNWNGAYYFPESVIDYDKFLKIISKYNIDVISIYNNMDISEVNDYINESMKHINRFMYHWYFNKAYRGNDIPINFINNYSDRYTKSYEFHINWKYKNIKDKPFIALDDKKSLKNRNFNLFSQMYFEEKYNSSIIDYCTQYNIDVLPRWKSEYELYLNIKNSLNTQVLFQYSPKWLNKQVFDIYIPKFNIAIEYQGIQHYQAVDFFGGDKGYEETVKRDKSKENKAEKNNCKIIYHKYNDDIYETINIINNFI